MFLTKRIITLPGRIELSLSGRFRAPEIVEKELTEIGSRLERELKSGKAPICFVIMPFGKEDLDVVYIDYVKPSVEQLSFQCVRGDDIFGNNIIMDDVVRSIQESTILVADLTYKNANVFYELGLAHAMDKKVVLLAQSTDCVPFDLRHRRVCLYEYSPRGCKKLEQEIIEHVKAISDDSNE
ncbi:MAG: hypothetical protein GY928_03390 [Colwellia sp.]|nr:hypothetical protein [Colwellia sp.]